MTNPQRLALAAQRLTPCQLALRDLRGFLGREDMYGAQHCVQTLADALEDLETAVGAPVTPTALFESWAPQEIIDREA